MFIRLIETLNCWIKIVKQSLTDLKLPQLSPQFNLYAVYYYGYYLLLNIIIQILITILLLNVFFQSVDLVPLKSCHVKFYKILHVKFLQNFCKILCVKFSQNFQIFTYFLLTDFSIWWIQVLPHTSFDTWWLRNIKCQLLVHAHYNSHLTNSLI